MKAFVTYRKLFNSLLVKPRMIMGRAFPIGKLKE